MKSAATVELQVCTAAPFVSTKAAISFCCVLNPRLGSYILIEMCLNGLFRATRECWFICDVTIALNLLSFKEMVTSYTQMFQQPSTNNASCVGVFLRLSVVRIKNLILKPPCDPLNLPRSEATTQHSGMTQTFRAADTWHPCTLRHAHSVNKNTHRAAHGWTNWWDVMLLGGGGEAFLCFEKHHYITLLHKARALRWPLQSAQRGGNLSCRYLLQHPLVYVISLARKSHDLEPRLLLILVLLFWSQ